MPWRMRSVFESADSVCFTKIHNATAATKLDLEIRRATSLLLYALYIALRPRDPGLPALFGRYTNYARDLWAHTP